MVPYNNFKDTKTGVKNTNGILNYIVTKAYYVVKFKLTLKRIAYRYI